ncbi:hypothetical protein EDD11_005904 [Mortierella claussenii]|nr:hypothetical protein EDD11_005904 [Mortierella claussenii]
MTNNAPTSPITGSDAAMASPTTTSTTTTTTTTGSGTSLRRGNTLKAYLANKNKLKERRAINIIVDPAVLQQQTEESSSGSEAETLRSPTSPLTATESLGGIMSPMSPVSGRRIDTDLDALDKERRQIEDQLAAITRQLHRLSAPSSPTAAIATDINQSSLFSTSTKEELIENRTRLCGELDVVLTKRRELLQSWARDYKNLKRSGSLSKPKDDLFWVTTA